MINYLATQKNWQNAFSDTITSFAELAQALDLPIDSFDSQVREDTGAGACELVWVESLELY